ncbi:uncharacterized protein LOC121728940 isoform X2 [Aricia agestis]|uniref:uncharacterized protein LOC121728940 isoform X2 n=1 Tax=Aricia agestis TaxID=91739 RepID=UPI001C207321|nr:uncharacterized protein LOC121728940 isoform X2 [Aricia agestis]
MAPTKKRKSLVTENLKLAVEEAKKTRKIREVARKYGIPKSTLYFKLKNPGHKTSRGPPPILTNEEEETLEKWILETSRKGFPLKKGDIQRSVQMFLRDNPRPNCFKNNYPGDGWFRNFSKRHPAISQRTSEGVNSSSACVAEADIQKWFSEITKYFLEKDLLKVFKEPSRIFYGDETGFQLCPKTGKVLAAKGSKSVYKIQPHNSNECITVMFSFAADGQYCPPMVIYNYQKIPQKVMNKIPEGWGVGRSDGGLMTSELFFEYVANVFYPYLIEKNIKFPVIFFVDGHKTHLTYEISKLCKALNIELIALYPNATCILQPTDIAVFRPIKLAWEEACHFWLTENLNETITKINFAEVLDTALRKSLKPQTLINGFEACGLVPFDPNAVDYNKCVRVSTINGKKKPANINDENITNIITYSNFIHLIGPSKIEEMKNCNNVDERDEHFQLLYKLYKAFGSPRHCDEAFQTAEETESIEWLDSPRISPLDTELDDIIIIDVDSFDNDIVETSTSKAYQEMTPENSMLLQTNDDKSIAFKTISDSLLGTYLTLPKTQERKGKRNTVKMPFAITSDSYRPEKKRKTKNYMELKKKEHRRMARELYNINKNSKKK